MTSFKLFLPICFVLAACTGDSGFHPDSLRVPDSTFYDRQQVRVGGQIYTVVTRPASGGNPDQYFVEVDGRYFECTAPTDDGCAAAVGLAQSREEH